MRCKRRNADDCSSIGLLRDILRFCGRSFRAPLLSQVLFRSEYLRALVTSQRDEGRTAPLQGLPCPRVFHLPPAVSGVAISE